MSNKRPSYLPSIGRLLGFAHAAVTRVSSQRLKPHGLTMQNWIVLTALWRTPWLSESELADYCHMSLSAMSKLVDRMEGKGLLRRERDPDDARRAIIHLADEGRAKAHLIDFYEEINQIALKGFTEAEAQALRLYLERIIENTGAALKE